VEIAISDTIEDLVKKKADVVDIKCAEDELIKRIAPRTDVGVVVRSKTRKQHLIDELFTLEKEKTPTITKAEFLKQNKKFTILELEATIDGIKRGDMTEKIIAVEKHRDPSLDVEKIKEELARLPELDVQKKLADVTSNAILNKNVVNEEIGVRTLMMLNFGIARACEAASVPLLEKYEVPINIRGWCHDLQTTKKEELREIFREIFRKYYKVMAPLMDPLVILAVINFDSLHSVILENAIKKKDQVSRIASGTSVTSSSAGQ
jgi:hypothetical protein